MKLKMLRDLEKGDDFVYVGKNILDLDRYVSLSKIKEFVMEWVKELEKRRYDGNRGDKYCFDCKRGLKQFDYNHNENHLVFYYDWEESNEMGGAIKVLRHIFSIEGDKKGNENKKMP